MDPEKNIETIFCEAVEISSAAERAAYLDRFCGEDTALRREAERLIADHFEAGDFLERPAAVRDATWAQPMSEKPGTPIGPYKLLQQIGEGGFGVVFMAEQTAPVRRKVALKVIKPGMDSWQVIARFEAERQALAVMDHPNIARVLDAGATETGRPYFVMELVRGVPITAYSDEHNLPIRERLTLFATVCQAIQHAHTKGIIHRDIKPSNVLVTRQDGQPLVKVIDFGVAKAMGQQLTEKTLFTEFAQMVGTPLYMSPEQAELSSVDIDTRSDIYSLGVLLYELLTGTTPVDKEQLKKAAFDEIRRIIREDDPPKPSTRISTAEAAPSIAAHRQTEPARLSRLVRGELDWIVMKALEKDRNRRYETAAGFAADVHRYLNDEPVQACSPSASYRLRKFARRNKVGLGVAALVLCFLVVLGSGVGWAIRDRAAQEEAFVRDRAAREVEFVRDRDARRLKVGQQVELIFAEVDRLEREQFWPEALTAARRAEAAVAVGETDLETAHRVRERLMELRFIDRLEEIRMLRWTLVDGQFDMARTDRAFALAFRNYGVDVEELPVETSIERLKTRPTLAIALAAALDDWAAVRRAISTPNGTGWEPLVAVARGIDPDPVRDRLRSVRGQPLTAELQNELRRLADSIDFGAQHPATLVGLANTLTRANLSEDAIKLLREAQLARPGDFWLNYTLGGTLHQQQDYDGAIRYNTAAVSIRPNSAVAPHNLGYALYKQKKLNEAIDCYRKAIKNDPEFSYAYNNLGNALHEQEKLDEAIDCYRKAIELDPKDSDAYCNLGVALRDQKKLPEAIDCYRTAIELNPKFASAYCSLGNALREQKNLVEAIDCYRTAIKLDPKDAGTYNNLGNALRDQKKLSDAIDCYLQAVELNPNYAMAYSNLSIVLNDLERLDEAVDASRKAIELDPKYANAYGNLGNALRKQKKLDEAVDAYHKAIELNPNRDNFHDSLGIALVDQEKLDEAIASYKKALELNPQSDSALHNLGIVLDRQGKFEEALDDIRKSLEIDPTSAITHSALGSTLTKRGMLDEGIVSLKKSIALDANDAAPHSTLGEALAELGKFDEAIAACSEAIRIQPDYSDAWSNRGWAYFQLGRIDQALADLNHAIEIAPHNSRAWNQRSRVYRRLNRPEDALADCAKAIELDATSAPPWFNRGEAYRQLGQWANAAEAYRTAIDLKTLMAPDIPRAYFHLAESHAEQGKLVEAIAELSELRRISPDFSSASEALEFLQQRKATLDANLSRGAMREQLQLHWPGAHILSVTFTPDGKRVLAASEASSGSLWLFDIAEGRVVRRFGGPGNWVNQASLSPDGRRALAACQDNVVRLWDLESGNCLRSLEGHTDAVHSVAFNPDGIHAVSAGSDSTIRIWDLDNGHQVKQCHAIVSSVAYSPDGARLVTAGADGALRVWDATSLQEVQTFAGHKGGAWCATFTPDGHRLLSAGEDRVLRLWDAEDGTEIRCFEQEHENPVNWVAVSADGHRAVSTSHMDQLLVLWDVETGRALSRFAADRRVNRGVLGPDGRVVCGSYRSVIYVFGEADQVRPQ